MATARTLHTATLLDSGSVLIVGGFDGTQSVSTAELFDPVNGQFIIAGASSSGRYDHSATLLDNGTVLIAGGLSDAAGAAVATAALYVPATNRFTTTDALVVARGSHTATLLDDALVEPEDMLEQNVVLA